MRIALVGLGVALLALALPLTGFASAEVGGALAGVAILVLIAGATPDSLRRRLPFGHTGRDRDAALATVLAAFLKEGNELAATIPDEHEQAAMDSAYAAGSAWAMRVRDVIQSSRPAWVDLFLDDMFGPQYLARTRREDHEFRTGGSVG